MGQKQLLPDKYIYDIQPTAHKGAFKRVNNRGQLVLDYQGQEVIIIDRFSKDGFKRGQEVDFCTIAGGNGIIYGRELYDSFYFFDFYFNLLEKDKNMDKAMSFLEKVLMDDTIERELIFRVEETPTPFEPIKQSVENLRFLFKKHSNATGDLYKPKININTASDRGYNGFLDVQAYSLNEELNYRFNLRVSFPLDGLLEGSWITINEHFKEIYGRTMVGLINKERSSHIRNRLVA